MNFIEKYSKFHQTFPYKTLSLVRQSERGMDIMNRNSLFHYRLINELHIYRSLAKFLTILQERLITVCRIKTAKHLDHLVNKNAFRSESPHLIYHTKIQSVWISLRLLSGDASYYVNTTALLTLPVQYKLQNAVTRSIQWV